MRYIVMIAALIVASSCAGPMKTAGIYDEHIPLHTSTLVVRKNMPVDSAYQYTASMLLKNGFVLDKTDRDLGVITTEPKAISSGAVNTIKYTFHLEEQDNSTTQIVMRGSFYVSALGTAAIEKGGMNGSPQRDAWKVFYNFASQMGDHIYYR